MKSDDTILAELSRYLAADPQLLATYISTCPHRYKKYEIPKRNGTGSRSIAQPARELKNLQRIACTLFLGDLPCHDACTAYTQGKNIRDNAIFHAKNHYFLKMDFRSFFTSIRPRDLEMHLKKYANRRFSRSDFALIGRIFFYKHSRSSPLVLSMGAPTSPYISNTIMFDFDTKISSICKDLGISYTRYADDLTFSTKRKGLLFDFKENVRAILKECNYPRLQLNDEKTLLLSHKGNVRVTGLIITPDHKLSIGRDKKRYIKSLVHKLSTNQLSPTEHRYLAGFLSYCSAVEPEFIQSLKRKYSAEVIRLAMTPTNVGN